MWAGAYRKGLLQDILLIKVQNSRGSLCPEPRQRRDALAIQLKQVCPIGADRGQRDDLLLHMQVNGTVVRVVTAQDAIRAATLAFRPSLVTLVARQRYPSFSNSQFSKLLALTLRSLQLLQPRRDFLWNLRFREVSVDDIAMLLWNTRTVSFERGAVCSSLTTRWAELGGRSAVRDQVKWLTTKTANLDSFNPCLRPWHS